ncbi:MAG: alpha-ketoglutarate-dependent dioxygenase AlkB [Alphaproteobacteria bacterium]|nr:MAG: alpha-ketoglutarate-dependent dioxygenase AlkB [Alphaproteobacteria bacterium]
MTDLLAGLHPDKIPIRDGVVLLPGFCDSDLILRAAQTIVVAAPFRHMTTPGGRPMSVAITNCGTVGWVSDAKGYRYAPRDPLSQRPWPAMPDCLAQLATDAAGKAGFSDFHPDSCLINRYQPTAHMGPHQDKDEQSFDWPIVSVSLGLSALFQLYGDTRKGPALNIRLDDGDVLVFGGAARMNYHGVRKILTQGPAPLPDQRLNLTFRRALT